MEGNVINLVSDEDEEETPIRRPPKRPRVVHTSSPSSAASSAPPNASDDELVVVSHTKRGCSTKRTDSAIRPSSRGTERAADEGVECVGERRGIQALSDYPHFRFQCAIEQFKRARGFKKERHCERCFCYVCDIPAEQCKTWMSHAKAVDTVPKWRAEREARLEERRRREQCGTADRGTIVSRISQPVRVRNELDDSESFEIGNSSDALDCDGESCSGDEEEEISSKCDFDRTIEKLNEVSIETDCFKMVSLQRELEAENVRSGSRVGRRQFDMAELLD